MLSVLLPICRSAALGAVFLSGCAAAPVSPEPERGEVEETMADLLPVIVIVRAGAVHDAGGSSTGHTALDQVRDTILSDVFRDDDLVTGPAHAGGGAGPRLRETFEVSGAFSMLVREADMERLDAHPDVERVLLDEPMQPLGG